MALSGYAAAWKSAYDSNGGNTAAANAAANQATYGNSSGPSTASQVARALSGTNFASGTKVSGGDGRSYSYSGGGKNKTPTITPDYSSYEEDNKSTSNQVFFPDQSNYLNTSSWLQSGTGNAANSNNSGLGLDLLGNTNTGVFIPSAKYTVDSQGNIIRTENTEEMSTASGTPTTNPITGINNNNYFDTQGFAYTDKYGFPHVVHDYQTALDYSGNGDIASYQGPYGGGYALGEGGSRVFIPLPGAVQYGNEGNTGAKTTATTSKSSVDNIASLDTDLTADRAKGLANMLMSRGTPQPTTDTDYDALLRQSQGANYNNLTPEEKATIIQMMKILRGVA